MNPENLLTTCDRLHQINDAKDMSLTIGEDRGAPLIT